MKKFLLKVSIFILYSLILQVVISIIIDPFNVFHAYNIRDNGIEPNKNYVKMKYILANPEKFDSFMFGSSRVGNIHTDKISDYKVYNMTYSAGTPREHLDNLKTFLSHNIYPQKISIGVDSYSYTELIDDHIHQHFRCPYEYLRDNFIHFCRLYIDIARNIEALEGILKHSPSKKFVERFYKYGWNSDYNRETKFDWKKSPLEPSFGSKYNLSGTLNDLREIVNLCRENNIELVIFTNPMHNVTYRASVNDKNYFEFLEGLAQITDFYNFSSLNNITLNNDNYLETSHYKAEVGDIIINVICNGAQYPELQAQGFGVKVTRDNVKDLITLLESQL
ncbi:MAG: hypothetical protein IJT21_05510 [Synergistaceae bacterium]|nr:hypothetical protein [Synergistaceae bacterium]